MTVANYDNNENNNLRITSDELKKKIDAPKPFPIFESVIDSL